MSDCAVRPANEYRSLPWVPGADCPTEGVETLAANEEPPVFRIDLPAGIVKPPTSYAGSTEETPNCSQILAIPLHELYVEPCKWILRHAAFSIEITARKGDAFQGSLDRSPAKGR